MKPYTVRQFRGDLKDGKRQGWYWDLVAPNGEIVAASAEGYANRKHCQAMWHLILPWIDLATQKGLPPARVINWGLIQSAK